MRRFPFALASWLVACTHLAAEPPGQFALSDADGDRLLVLEPAENAAKAVAATVAVWGGEASAGRNATWAGMATHALNALLGAFDRPGGVTLASTIPLRGDHSPATPRTRGSMRCSCAASSHSSSPASQARARVRISSRIAVSSSQVATITLPIRRCGMASRSQRA